MREKPNLGVVVKKKPLAPMKQEPARGSWAGGRWNQELEAGSKAKDWLFLEEVLWRPKRKNQGRGLALVLWAMRAEKDGAEIMERQDLQTEEARMRVGIGRRERIRSVMSVLRVVKAEYGLWSDIFFFFFVPTLFPGMKKET